MASGVPVVQPRRGASTEIVETTGGGILVEPDNPDALAEGILELWRTGEETGAGREGIRWCARALQRGADAERALEVYQSLLVC